MPLSDDIAYIAGVAGEDRLVVGTDCGHHDSSTEIEAMGLMKAQNKLKPMGSTWPTPGEDTTP